MSTQKIPAYEIETEGMTPEQQVLFYKNRERLNFVRTLESVLPHVKTLLKPIIQEVVTEEYPHSKSS